MAPKVSYAEQVRNMSEAIILHEEQQGWRTQTIRLIAQVESAMGLANLKEIAAADQRLDALIFGAEDYASDVGAKRTPEGNEVFYARSAVVAHAAAFGLQAINMLGVDFKEIAGLERVAVQGAQLCYSGMQVIHPGQIASAQRAFTPSPEELAVRSALWTLMN